MSHDWLRSIITGGRRVGKTRLAEDAVAPGVPIFWGKEDYREMAAADPARKAILEWVNPEAELFASIVNETIAKPWDAPDSDPIEDLMALKKHFESREYAEGIERQNRLVWEQQQLFHAKVEDQVEACLQLCVDDPNMPGVLVCTNFYGDMASNGYGITSWVGNVPGIEPGRVVRFLGTPKEWEEQHG